METDIENKGNIGSAQGWIHGEEDDFGTSSDPICVSGYSVSICCSPLLQRN